MTRLVYRPRNDVRRVEIPGLVAEHPEMGEVDAIAIGETTLGEACIFELRVDGGEHDGAALSFKCLEETQEELERMAVEIRNDEERDIYDGAGDYAYDQWKDGGL